MHADARLDQSDIETLKGASLVCLARQPGGDLLGGQREHARRHRGGGRGASLRVARDVRSEREVARSSATATLGNESVCSPIVESQDRANAAGQISKKGLSEADICAKFITPAIERAGWDDDTQIRREVHFTKGQIHVRGKMVTRGKSKFADYVLYYKPNIPIAIVEAKDNDHSVGDGMQQALDYAETLNIPFVFSSNGDGFVFHDRTGTLPEVESTLPLDGFPSPARLWSIYREWKGLNPSQEEIVLQDYFDDGGGREPRYYQRNAINAATEAIAKGQDRVLLVMATGTGKTYTAFQIIWRLWKSGRRSASSISPTATCSSTRRWSTTFGRSRRRWRS